jgi:hypothetical protein
MNGLWWSCFVRSLQIQKFMWRNIQISFVWSYNHLDLHFTRKTFLNIQPIKTKTGEIYTSQTDYSPNESERFIQVKQTIVQTLIIMFVRFSIEISHFVLILEKTWPPRARIWTCTLRGKHFWIFSQSKPRQAPDGFFFWMD